MTLDLGLFLRSIAVATLLMICSLCGASSSAVRTVPGGPASVAVHANQTPLTNAAVRLYRGPSKDIVVPNYASISTAAVRHLFVGAAYTTPLAPETNEQAQPPLVAHTLTITKGGTYYGDWVSTNPSVAAVTVYTDEPVIIENSTVTGRGTLIGITGTNGANVTIRNVTGTALDPQVAGKARGAFVVAYIINSLLVQNCTMTGTSFGVKAAFSTPASLKILNNSAINLEDRASDGNGGFQTVRPQLGHFVYLFQMSLPSGAEIGWNKVVQTMGQSSVDNVIDVFKSQGTATNPISVHDNYVEGASSAGSTSYAASSFSATGDSTSQEAAFANFLSNQVVHTAGNGLTISNGYNITATGNRVVSCGKDSAGSWYSRAGLWAISMTNKSAGPSFYSNVITTTSGGLIVPGAQNAPVASDAYASPAVLVNSTNSIDGNLFTDPCLVGGTLTLAAEDVERTYWANKISANNQLVGDQHGPVAVTVTPSTAALTPTQTQQFSASVVWASNPAVVWSLSSGVGSISATGLYTAPASVTGSQTATATAASVQDPTKSASATITITTGTVSVTPATAALTPSQTQQYTAAIQATSQNVTWSISPSVGAISSAGLYTAPSSITSVQTVTVTAVSVADATKSATSIITLNPPVKVSLATSSATLTVNQTSQFSAQVQNTSNTAVTWTISPSVGTISSSGLYTAPATIATQQTVTFTATSVADSTKSASGSIVLSPIAVTVVPGAVALAPSGTQQFTGNVSGAANTAVTWSMSPVLGTLSSAGLYTAPASLAATSTVTVTATSVADPTRASSAIVTVNTSAVAISPGSLSLYASQVQQFSAQVLGNPNQTVAWSVSPAIGVLSSSGVYTAPSVISSVTILTIKATSAASPSNSASTSLTLLPPIKVNLPNNYASLGVSQTKQFTAVVANSSNPAVTWAISPAIGSINSTGLYSSPATLAGSTTVTFTATSVADPTKSASGSIQLTPPVSVNVAPGYVKLVAGGTQQFNASVYYTSNTAVTWSMSPAIGTLSSTGLYTAPASISASTSVTITATSVADPTKSANATIPLSPAVSVNVTPSGATLYANASKQFSASVYWTTNTAVTWSMSPAIGTLSATGLYTAPSSVPTSSTVTITATSVADATKSASAVVNLNQAVSVNITPAGATLYAKAAQQFSAGVYWTTNTAVTWSLSPAVGTLSATGLYTAPASIPTNSTVTVTATSVADPTKSASSVVNLNQAVSISITPAGATLYANAAQQFSASVYWTTNTGVTWSMSPAVGTLSATGLYIAPSSIPTSSTVTITATSVADPTKSASANVNLNQAVAVNITPAGTNLYANASQQFSASVYWTTNTAVTWSMSPAVGTLSATGLYIAPSSIPTSSTVTITATSVADPTKSASSVVNLNQAVSINITPAGTTLYANAAQQFSASVYWTTNTAVTWSMSPAVGTLSATGLYTAPASIPTSSTVTITATSVADPTKAASAVVNLNQAVSINITPAGVRLYANAAQQFSASVYWTTNTGVTWSMSPAVGTLSAAGLYTAPASIPTSSSVTITATSVADPTKSASAVVNLNQAVSINITPAGTTLYANAAQQLTASVYWTPNTAVTWSMSPAIGTLSATGLYTAPSSIPSSSSVTITVTSVADPTKSASAVINLNQAVSINITPSGTTLYANATQQFTANAYWTTNTAVTWSMSPAVGTLSATGLYTAPASIPTGSTVTVTATSVADPTKSISAYVNLNQPLSIIVAPATVALVPNQTQQFSPGVYWTNNAAVTWSLSPNVGTISSDGLYTAPAINSATQNVTVTVTSVADPTKSADAAITLIGVLPGTLYINKGGTYSGAWGSSDPTVPAITVRTDEPVIIQNSTLTGFGDLIQIRGNSGANVTVMNVTGTASNANVAGVQRGSFINAYTVNSLIVTNNTITGTLFGVYVGNSTLTNLSITRNLGFDLEDRASDGNGGLLTTRPVFGHFVQIAASTAPNGTDIAWNQVKQTIGQTSTEDVFSVYRSQGTSTSPISMHDNYMEGYSSSTSDHYSGVGLTADGDTTHLSAYVNFTANEMLHTSGGGIGIANGHDITAANNRVVSCGKDASGAWYAALYHSAVGMQNYYSSAQFYNNTIIGTVGGMVIPDVYGQPAVADGIISPEVDLNQGNSIDNSQFTDPCLVNGTLNIGAEDTERTFWANKLSTNNITLGDRH